MPTFSRSLEQSLHRALALANERHHEYATLEHLLLALIDDQDAAAVMRACNVDTEKLKRNLASYLLDTGFTDVWAVDFRMSNRFPYDGETHRYTLDDIADYDHPAALAGLRLHVGEPPEPCIRHDLRLQQIGRFDGKLRPIEREERGGAVPVALHEDLFEPSLG